jgi:hypothetical protein
MASLARLISAVFVIVACFASASTSFAVLSSKTLSPYVDGLDALNEGRWPDAASAFSRALAINSPTAA